MGRPRSARERSTGRAYVTAAGSPGPLERNTPSGASWTTDSAEVVLLDGVACSYKRLEDGRRQICSFAYPGDFCDLNRYVLPESEFDSWVVEQGRWLPQELLCADLPARFGYVTSPQARCC